MKLLEFLRKTRVNNFQEDIVADDILDIILGEQDSVIVVTGVEGSGKSTFSIYLALLYSELFAEFFSLFYEDPLKALESGRAAKYIYDAGYTAEDILKRLSWTFNDFYRNNFTNPKYFFDIKVSMFLELHEYVKFVKKNMNMPFKIWVWDEAVIYSFSRDSMNRFNRYLVKFFNINRSFRHVHILNIPNIFYLDIYLREQRTKHMYYIAKSPSNFLKRLAFYVDKDLLNRILIDPYIRKSFSNVYAFAKYISKATHKFVFPDLYELEIISGYENLVQNYKEKKANIQKLYLQEFEKILVNMELSEEDEYMLNMFRNKLKDFLDKNNVEIADEILDDESYVKALAGFLNYINYSNGKSLFANLMNKYKIVDTEKIRKAIEKCNVDSRISSFIKESFNNFKTISTNNE